MALDANRDNAIVTFVLDMADKLDGPFSRDNGVFTFEGKDGETKGALVNWGIAAVVPSPARSWTGSSAPETVVGRRGPRCRDRGAPAGSPCDPPHPGTCSAACYALVTLMRHVDGEPARPLGPATVDRPRL